MKRAFEKIIAIASELVGTCLRYLNSDSRKTTLKMRNRKKGIPLRFWKAFAAFGC